MSSGPDRRVFVPALDGLKVQWREASENLGASAWQYWRHIAAPLLAPAFFGSLLLLFANALSAYATIQAWENQIPYVVPQLIGTAKSDRSLGLSPCATKRCMTTRLLWRVAVWLTVMLGSCTPSQGPAARARDIEREGSEEADYAHL